jgi:hypothetical protein
MIDEAGTPTCRVSSRRFQPPGPSTRRLFFGGGVEHRDETAWLGRQDSKLCISESEFAKTLSSGRAHSNLRISIEGCRVPPHCQRKFQAMIDSAADLIRNAEVRILSPQPGSWSPRGVQRIIS